MKKAVLWLTVAVLSFGISGCDSAIPIPGLGIGKEAEEETTKEETTEEETTEEETTEEETEAGAAADDYTKYNAYIDVNNMMLDRLDFVIGSYFDDVDFQEEFTPYEEDYWCNSLGDYYIETIDEAYALVDQKPEYPELDKAYKELYPVMRELMEDLDAVHEYTDLKSYLDDDYAKGEELHAAIWKNVNLYFILSDTFYEEMNEVADEQREIDLAAYKEEGLMAHYYSMKVLVTAQEIQSAIYDQGVTDENIIELDIEALRPLYNQFVEEVEECLKYFNDDDQLAKEGYYGISSIYTSALKDTKVSLSELFKRVEEQRPLSEVDWMSHEAIPRTGTIREFESELSDLIDEYNRL